MMRYAASLSFKTPRLCQSHLSNQVSGTPFDCSFIFTCPVQTSVGELDVDRYACLRSNWLLNCPIVLATRQHRPRDPCQLVCRCDDQDVSRSPRLKRGHPCTHRDSVSLRSQHDCACPVNQDLAQVVVTALADPVEFWLTAWRELLRHQTHPRCKLSRSEERCAVRSEER